MEGGGAGALEGEPRGGGAGEDGLDDGDEALALGAAEPPPDMSRHKSGIIPMLQCARGALCRTLCVGRPAHRACAQPALRHAALRNLVATVNLDCKLDLKKITLHARNAEYNPKARARPQYRGGHAKA